MVLWNQDDQWKLWWSQSVSLQHVVIRSATPQLSKNVLSLTDGNNIFENAIISFRPIRMIAAYTYVENQNKNKIKEEKKGLSECKIN